MTSKLDTNVLEWIKQNNKIKREEIAAKYNVPVIDVYAKWKELESYGIDTSLLLCNYINHPTRKMHYLFANMICSFLEENKYVD